MNKWWRGMFGFIYLFSQQTFLVSSTDSKDTSQHWGTLGDENKELPLALFFYFAFYFKACHFSLVAQLCLTLWPHGLQHVRLPCSSPTPKACSNLYVHWVSQTYMSSMPSNHLILCHPLLLLPSNFPSIRVFSNDSVLHIRWPKYWSFSFNISPSNEYSGKISFRMDWLYLPTVQGTLKSLL